MPIPTVTAVTAAALAIVPGVAQAHSFVEPYLLPVPFWLYVYACGATLVATFAILGYFVGADVAVRPAWTRPLHTGVSLAPLGRVALWTLRLGALACLVLTIVAGLFGTGDPLSNIAMSLFWMIFILGFAYVTVLIGDLYELVNPYATIVACVDRIAPGFSRARIRYPERLGYYPGFALYVALIWIELFVLPKPATLAWALLALGALTLAGSFVFGRASWFRYCDVFAIFFRMIALLAPVEYVPAGRDRWAIRVRSAFRAAADAPAAHMGLVLFILFMLSSTTYDAMRETDLWTSLYWKQLIHLAQPLWGTDMVKAQGVLTPWFAVYQRAGLLLSPFAYLALYLLMLEGARWITRSEISLGRLALEFAPSLIPIAVVYNVTHYYTMLIVQVEKFPWIATDPFGFGWNLLGLSARENPPPLDMGLIWHTQVALILIGHVASVYLAHIVAMRIFRTRRQAIASQVPLLLLMVAYTAIGLYILSLPLASPAFVE